MKRLWTTLALMFALMLPHLLMPPAALAFYRLAYGDDIAITIKNAPQYDVSGAIRPDGEMTVPFVGDIEVAGLTTGEVRDRVTKLLSSYVLHPEVMVVVSGFRSLQVTMLGEIHAPGIVRLPPGNTTLFDAIASAGGFTDRAVRDRVIVIRGNGPNAQRFVVNVAQMIQTADFTNNMTLEGGDKVQVPEVWYPNIQQVTANISVALGFISTIAVIVALYQRASGP